MTDDSIRAARGDEALQFDTAVPLAAAPGAQECTTCKQPISSRYYTVRQSVLCEPCKVSFEAYAREPHGSFARAFGFGALWAALGSLIHYTVAAVTGLNTALIAILVGYLVGKGVRKGSDERGGLRFQILAVALTYFAIDFAYVPYLVAGVRERSAEHARDSVMDEPAPSASASTSDATSANAQHEPGAALALVLFVGLTLSLPIYTALYEFPQHAISLLILAFGLWQAWKMNRATPVVIEGPFQLESGGLARG